MDILTRLRKAAEDFPIIDGNPKSLFEDAAKYVDALEEKLASEGLAECPHCGSFDVWPCSPDVNGDMCADICRTCEKAF